MPISSLLRGQMEEIEESDLVEENLEDIDHAESVNGQLGFFAVDGFTPLTTLIDDGAVGCNNLLDLLKERVDCELAYAKALRKWHHAWQDRLVGKLLLLFSSIFGVENLYTSSALFRYVHRFC